MGEKKRDFVQGAPRRFDGSGSPRGAGGSAPLSLASAGRDGYAEAIERQTEMGKLLASKLTVAGWQVISSTDPPIVCFTDPHLIDGEEKASLYEAIVG